MDILKIIKRYQIQLVFLIIFITSLSLFYPSLNYYFFQDDWFHVVISRPKDVNDFFQLFSIRTDVIGWRPISKQLFFLITDRFFNLNPFSAHVVIFSFHILNGLLLFFLVRLLFRSTLTAIITSYLYLTASFHFVALSWLSAGEYIIGAFFWFLSLLSYFVYRARNKKRYYILSFISFLLSLASTEFAVTLPIIILIIEIYRDFQKPEVVKKIASSLLILVPQLLVIAIYLVLRVFIFPIPAKETYQMVFNFSVIKSLLWYFLWFLNVPEVLKYQINFPNLLFFPDQTFWIPFKDYVFSLFSTFLILLLAFTYLIMNNLSRRIFSMLIVALVVFMVALSPVIFLPKHTFPNYLTIPAASLSIFMAFCLSVALEQKKTLNFILVILIITSWFILSYTNLAFTKRTHWIPAEDNLSRKFTKQISDLYRKLPSNSKVLIYPATDQLRQSLMDQNALRAIYNDLTLTTIYAKNINDIKGIQESFYLFKYELNP